ncbi:glycosyltransferase [Actinosynnema sp. NPDC047251]|uniref:Glycosyltransferase, family 1 n=1 Tax=Saccharothrix espanaensis (strain ATCC 51144 / DSM 44229 / JCM 9112 / NBRC 15066 / NRRL 15764) TaxID=1179773 RepID=K0K6X5_SACES|nr:glycosyltransferase [Saccharothrix espanaensis]CCH33287.1 Glycosyltransferase, family 1 [Saccharothrix espanaensis DSM 44229]
MKILFSSLGSHGHTYPLLPLAIAAHEHGHDVTFATTPDFAPAVERHGIRHLPAGLGMRAAVTEATAVGADDPIVPTDVDQELILRVFGSILPRRNFADLTPYLERSRPDLVVHELANPGAGLAARVAGIPALCHGFGRMWESDLLEAPTPFLEFCAEIGVDVPAEHPMVLGNPYLDVCPPSVQDKKFLAAVDAIALRPVPFAEPGDLPDWVVAHDQPLVYLTLGTAFGSSDVLRTAITGLSEVEGTRLLVAVGPSVEPGMLGEVPEQVTVLPWVPQADLLRYTDLVVHHGGSGTTLGAFGAGLPQLVLPQGADQFSNAEAVLSHGLGDRLVGDLVTSGAIADRARHLLVDPAVRAAAGTVAAEVAAMPSPAEVAARLSEYAR